MERFLGWSFPIDEAEATAGAGYSRGYGPLRGFASDDPRGRVRPEPRLPAADYRPPAPEVPRWQGVVDQHVDKWPGYMQRLIPLAMHELGWLEHLVLELHCRQGLSFREIERRRDRLGHALGLSSATVYRAHWEGLMRVAGAVWLNGGTGAPNFGLTRDG